MSSYKNIKGKGTQMFYYWGSGEDHEHYWIVDVVYCSECKLIKQLEAENTIQKLPKRRGVKLSSSVAGQRELIREMRNKLDEVIDVVNELKGKV